MLMICVRRIDVVWSGTKGVLGLLVDSDEFTQVLERGPNYTYAGLYLQLARGKEPGYCVHRSSIGLSFRIELGQIQLNGTSYHLLEPEVLVQESLTSVKPVSSCTVVDQSHVYSSGRAGCSQLV
jgi:hypothetical protein